MGAAQPRGPVTLCLGSSPSGHHWCPASGMRVQGNHSLGGNTEAQLPDADRLEDMGVGELTLHGILHVLSKQVPHHFGADFTHIQLLGKPGEYEPWEYETLADRSQMALAALAFPGQGIPVGSLCDRQRDADSSFLTDSQTC